MNLLYAVDFVDGGASGGAATLGRAGRREGEEFSVDVEGFDEVVVSVVIDDVRGDSESGGVDIVDDEALGPVDVEDRFRIWCSLYFGKCHTPLSFLFPSCHCCN